MQLTLVLAGCGSAVNARGSMEPADLSIGQAALEQGYGAGTGNLRNFRRVLTLPPPRDHPRELAARQPEGEA
jgi:hypothetical protein